MADIVMPQLGETVTEGTITRWLKSVGDPISEDEVLFEVSTDKVDSEVPSPASGVVTEILVAEGDTVDVGTRLAVISDGDAAAAPSSGPAVVAADAPAEAEGSPDLAETPASAPEAPAPEPGPAPEPAPVAAEAPPAPAATEAPAASPQSGTAGSGGGSKVLSPVVRRLIAEHDLDPATITGTGAGGRITRADVLALIDRKTSGNGSAPAPASAAAPAGGVPAGGGAAPAGPAPAVEPFAPSAAGERDTIVPFTNIRRRTAEHMIRSKHTSAHTMVAVEVDYLGVEKVRAAGKASFREAEGFGLTYLPFIARATVDAIAEFPHTNSSVGDDVLVVHNDLNLGIAVDLDFEGLLVPVIHEADGKRLRQLAREISGLAGKARAKRLTMDDISGGTFTITNAGPFGTLITVPVINQPQVAILSTDGVRKRPVAVELPDGTDGIAVHPVGNLVMSWDHRAFDGAYAAAFLARIKDILETREWSAELCSSDLLRVRWLGRVRYSDAHALQHGLWSAPRAGAAGSDDWLLLLEHPHVYTLGVRADPAHVLVDPASVGAEVFRTDRGGDVTYHGPGQLVGYPIRDVPAAPGATPRYVHGIEQLVIDVLADLGLPGASRLDGYPGVWIGAADGTPRKICAIGVRLSRGRSMHGFALNVDADMSYFGHIVPCGIADKPVTSLRAEGVDASLHQVVDAVVARAQRGWGYKRLDRQDVAWRVRTEDLAPFTRGAGPGPLLAGAGGGVGDGPGASGAGRADRPQPVRLLGRLAEAGVDPAGGLAVEARKPEWLRVQARMGDEYRSLRRTMRSLQLVTVCEEAGCPNIFECWADGTATFMINGDRCTRACGFCLVDTRKPLPADPDEPERVAEAVARLGLAHAVVTTVARDDLADDGAGAFAETVAAIRRRSPATAVELLISDCRGHDASLATIFAARPDVLNHNVETVPRLQRAVRPSASYARSLAVLARAKAAGLTTKSGLIVGMGEEPDEVRATFADLHGVGVDIVTVGQYLRPTGHHLPVARWWSPAEFDELRAAGEALGIPHVEASPLTRSSYHARSAAAGIVTPASSDATPGAPVAAEGVRS